MSETFKALVLRQEGEKVRHAIEQLTVNDLPEGDVLVAVEYSSLNYKDAMAVMGTGKIVREYPMVPGVDLAGTVLESKSPFSKAGDQVVLTGRGVGERYWGGYTQRARVKSNWLVPLPEGLEHAPRHGPVDTAFIRKYVESSIGQRTPFGMKQKDPSLKTAEFSAAKKLSFAGTTEPRYFFTRSGCS